MLRRPFGSFMSPWSEMDRLRREMNRLFERSSAGPYVAPSYPPMNVWTGEDGAIVTAELPGISPDDIDISVVSDTLTVKGCHNPNQREEGATYHRQERSRGRFSRSFSLPFQVKASNVEAVFENGILRIALPRAEEDKPKKITVKAG